ncbi:c-type cytochrome [Solitalea lacus]|uniref:c-type cytochrome n=1 Tax=Solitalea lacus TaxID=2911172 RepID=UPI001ED9FB4A|nr:c-type cytochrome [Solitalea lacus]UKJ07343.1 c-type cytochrome [Solitalea lacus]
MRNNTSILQSFLTALGLVTLSLCLTDCANQAKPDGEMAKEQMVDRGQYLVTIASCNDCHSPKIMTPQGPILDSTRLMSGHRAGSMLPKLDTSMVNPNGWISMSPEITAFVGPWGISYAANLTPDETSGIGAWTEDTFIKTLRTGKHLGQVGGRQILPPMPWFFINKMTDEDLKSVFAYLKSLPPINNQVPAPVPPNELNSVNVTGK